MIRAFPVLAVAAALSASATARADDRPIEATSSMAFAERGDELVVTTSLTRLFDSAAYDSMDSGFPSTVVIRMWVHAKGQEKARPISFQLLQRSFHYDLWDEVYVLRLDQVGPTGAVERRTVKAKYKAEALKLVTALDAVPIAKVSAIPYEAHFVLAIAVELNPVSQETLAEVRRWLSDGTGGGLDRGGSFFGSFVSVFLNYKIPEADRVLRLRGLFYRPRRTPPAKTETR